MEFKSLNDAFATSFIKSLPHFTRLDLTANEIKIIELVLSFTHQGLNFYMNYATIAEYLLLNDTKTKAKTVGNIIGRLKKKGYISKVQTYNYNGKNGGSSVTLVVDEAYLEQQLHAAFNPVEVLDQNTPQATPLLAIEPVVMQLQNATPSGSADAEYLPSHPETRKQTAAEFVAELDAMNNEPLATSDLPCLAQLLGADALDESKPETINTAELALLQTDYQPMDEGTFKAHLQKLIRLDCMSLNRTALQILIDNRDGWQLDYRKGGLKYLVDELNEKTTR